MNSSPSERPGADDPPNVPGFSTWRGVYLLVFAWLVLVIVFLALFTRWFA